MPFYEIELPLAGLEADAVEAALLDCGASSITFVDRGDEPVLEPKPGEMRLWSDTLVRALFDGGIDAGGTLRRLERRLGREAGARASIRAVEDQVWERAWLVGWHAMQFGPRLWICPTTAAPPEDPAAVVLWLDPGLAFGTGTHPTTAMCLETLAALELEGRSVLDYGCGSGVLAIAALKLGAAHATGVDLDPQALLATRENALRNGVETRLVTQGPAAAVPVADFVIANILAGIVIDLRPVLTAAVASGGSLVLSGILVTQAAEVARAFAPWFDIVVRTHREEWCCLRGRRRSIPTCAGVS
jgi:ribosomal protein L11 methyltransferase